MRDGMIIKADSAEPDRIDEWNSRGWHVEGATKGMGSLRFGIDFLTRQRMHINKTKCQNSATFKTEKQAKSALAYAQLTQLMALRVS